MSEEDPFDKDKKKEEFNKYLSSMGGEIGTGAIFGYASGFATRTALKFVIFGFGLGFIGL
jgi:uncharacterized membrane protein (Fun14 family)